MPTLILTLELLNEKNKSLQDVKSPLYEAYLFNFQQGKTSHLWYGIASVSECSYQCPDQLQLPGTGPDGLGFL